MKSKAVAYILWWFLGVFGAHKFYLNKVGTGIAYLFTFGFLGIGWFIDLFTLSGQVDQYNYQNAGAIGSRQNQQQSQNIVVNVTAPAGAAAPQVSVSAEKQILSLTKNSEVLSIKQIIAQTNLEIDEAEEAVKKLVSRGMARELIEPDGKIKYDFS